MLGVNSSSPAGSHRSKPVCEARTPYSASTGRVWTFGVCCRPLEIVTSQQALAAALEGAVHIAPSTSVVGLHLDVFDARSLLILQG